MVLLHLGSERAELPVLRLHFSGAGLTHERERFIFRGNDEEIPRHTA
jgi:hypothetical protein